MDNKELFKIIGNAIAVRRRNINMTQEMLSELLDITPDALSRIENGHFAPKMGRLCHIASTLNCNVSDLFRAADENNADLPESFATLLKPLSATAQEDLLGLMIHATRLLHK